ncbi:methyl-accepting chemotaxis protein [Geofilum sp. OHC36d9]|uniref:methyl-accepting chemotaxis protein n=1 Tax=Geofilum sp. OHC36d9 TaxID=3458413 RepID=UPI00403444BB
MFFFIISSSLLCFILGYLTGRKKQKKAHTVQEISNTEKEPVQLKETTTETSALSRKEMERLSIVATQTENAIMIMDADGNIEWVNDGFTRLYGYTYEEFIKALGANIRDTSFSDAIEERLYTCQKLHKPVFYEALNITKTGKSIWTHTSLTPILNQQGELTYLATIDSDISKRKESSDELLQAIDQLSQRINLLNEKQSQLVAQTTKMMSSVEEANLMLANSASLTHFIQEISDKIKILGLNASIEAASMSYSNLGNSRNNGFRVIASEIIKLSEDSKIQTNKVATTMQQLESSLGLLNHNKESFNEYSDTFFKTLSEVRKGLLTVERVADRLNN